MIVGNAAKKNIELVTDADLISPIWKDRPSLPIAEIFEHDIEFAGKLRAEKLADIRTKMKAKGADFHLVTTLDDIGWTLNLRGSDVECNPVFVAYLVIGLERCDLFIENSIVVELKAVEKLLPIHEAQLLTYMNLLEVPFGILFNFNTTNIYHDGQKTFVNELYRILNE